MKTKVCTKCSIEKSVTEYRVITLKPSGNRVGGTYVISYCKQCERDATRKRYFDNHEENKKKAREYARNMTDEQTEARLKRHREWNREFRKSKKGKTYRRKLNQQPQQRLVNGYRKRLKKTLGGKFTSKSILQCDWKQFMLHIESQFTNKMSWDNYGVYWDLDHIIPLSAARVNGTYDEDLIIELSNWQNFQPLESVENQQVKGASIPMVSTLWSNTLNNKILTSHDYDYIRMESID